jgi:hypothetical protein
MELENRSTEEAVRMTERNEDRATRRGILQAGLAVIGGAVATRTEAQEKIPQAAVQYQATPKDGQKCRICVNFEAPNACKIVAGTISPDGWCIAFGPKS